MNDRCKPPHSLSKAIAASHGLWFLLLTLPAAIASAQSSSLMRPTTFVRQAAAMQPAHTSVPAVAPIPINAPVANGGVGVGRANGQGPYRPESGVPSATAAATPTLTVPSGASHGHPGAVYLPSASWTHQPSPPMRVFRKNDIITIRVDEITRMLAEGSAETRKQTLYEAVLSDWIRLTNFRLRPDPQGFGDPAVSVDSNNNYRAESEVETRESMTFNIAANVVDIRPNGTLLLEARKSIRVNDNLWETALSGSCRVADIAPDNTVLSRDLIDLEIKKEDRGHLRDGYRRGWFQRWLDRVGPF